MNAEHLDIQFETAAEQIRCGMALWNVIKEELKIQDSGCVLLFSESERDNNLVFLKYSELLTKHKGYSGIYILSLDEWVIDNAALYCRDVVATKQLSEYETDCLLKYYSLLEFSNRFYVCSVTQPEGRLGEVLIERGIPIDEIVCAGIYRVYLLGDNIK